MAKVLIADDEPETRAVLRRFLKAFDCETLEANDGEAALRSARSLRPDVVLLDIYMPKKDGIEVLKELAAEKSAARFVMVTGNEDEQVARECLELGAFDYVTKPIDLAILGEILESRLQLRRK
jgi:CheY-like chemotaxis protein